MSTKSRHSAGCVLIPIAEYYALSVVDQKTQRGRMSQWWEITGVLDVEELVTTRDPSGNPVVQRRPLAGITVEVAGWPDDHACFGVWGRAQTDANGRFRLRALRPSWPHRLRITASLHGDRLSVAEQNAERVTTGGWMTVCEPDHPVDGPCVDLGVLTFGESSHDALGDVGNIRRAATWYFADAAMTYLAGLCDGCRFSEPIAILYPASLATLRSHADPSARTGFIHRDDHGDDGWSVDTVLRQVMLLWSRQCERVRALWPAEPSVGHDRLTGVDRFAELAKNELFTVLWGHPSSLTHRAPRERSSHTL